MTRSNKLHLSYKYIWGWLGVLHAKTCFTVKNVHIHCNFEVKYLVGDSVWMALPPDLREDPQFLMDHPDACISTAQVA